MNPTGGRFTNWKIMLVISVLRGEFGRESQEKSDDWNFDDWPDLIIAVIVLSKKLTTLLNLN